MVFEIRSKVAVTMYGVTGEVSNEVKDAVSFLQKNSEVRIVIHESTGGSSQGLPQTATETIEPQNSDMLAIKERADKFYNDAVAGQHNFIRS